MKKLFAKKQFMMIALVVALGAAVYMNYYFTNEPVLSPEVESEPTVPDGALGDAYFVNGAVSDVPKEEVPSAAESDYFSQARDSRSAARNEALRLVQETLGRAEASAEEKKAAGEQAALIAERVLQESNIENLIVSKGFADCVVFIDGDKASVVVKADDLQAPESLQIMELVTGHAGIKTENIQIMLPKG